jgi:hypothetical protein
MKMPMHAVQDYRGSILFPDPSLPVTEPARVPLSSWTWSTRRLRAKLVTSIVLQYRVRRVPRRILPSFYADCRDALFFLFTPSAATHSFLHL